MTLLDRISRRQFLGGAAAMAAGAVFDACAPTTNAPTESTTPSAEPTPTGALDVVFRGGTILTMDPEQPDAAAVAVRGDSIVAVGSEAEVMAAASPGAMVVDLGGRVLLPGFNDAHCHRIDAAGSEGGGGDPGCPGRRVDQHLGDARHGGRPGRPALAGRRGPAAAPGQRLSRPISPGHPRRGAGSGSGSPTTNHGRPSVLASGSAA